MLVLLPEDKKPGFFFLGLFMDCLPADICSHLLTESITDPRQINIKCIYGLNIDMVIGQGYKRRSTNSITVKHIV